MLCSCAETSLGVKVACEQSLGKQLLLLFLWTCTRKQEGVAFFFDFHMQRKLFKSSGLCMMDGPKGRSVPVEGHAKAELVLGNFPLWSGAAA